MGVISELGRRAGELEQEQRFDEAEAVCREILALQPHHPAARYALAMLRLRAGDWTEGWTLYEARSELPEWGMAKPRPSYPEWRGEQILSLLVWLEQGLGDQIMFARWVPEIVRRGIAVTLVCSPALARLFGALGATVIPAASEITVPRHDAWCLIGSLPHLVGGLPTGPYLPSGPGGGGAGVVPTGNPTFAGDARRSLPEPFATELLAMGRDLRPTATGAADMEDSRRIVAGLDLVLSVDTSVAHLAGAMGKPVKLLAPYTAEWRWGLGDRSELYPTIEMVRQAAPGDWRGVLDRLKHDLAPVG